MVLTTQTAAGTTETESAGTTESESAGTTEALPLGRSPSVTVLTQSFIGASPPGPVGSHR